MPLQNRVDPYGTIITTTARGAWMGNRGLLHDRDRRIHRSWRLKAWLICRLEFRGRRRNVMTPGLYTELFFLDEATAFSAGHRPCFECRRADYLCFKDAAGYAQPRVAAMDDELHRQRLDEAGVKPVWTCEACTLPDGAVVALDGAPWLKWQGALHRWRREGYGPPRSVPSGAVDVLTPRLTINAIRRGYVPQVALG